MGHVIRPRGSTLSIQLTKGTKPSSFLKLILVSVALRFTQAVSQDRMKLPRAAERHRKQSAAPVKAGAELPAV